MFVKDLFRRGSWWKPPKVNGAEVGLFTDKQKPFLMY